MTSKDVIGFLLWLLWVAIALLVIAAATYLFVGGSSLFAHNRDAGDVIVYQHFRTLDNDTTMVSVTGSLSVPSVCHGLDLSAEGTVSERTLVFTVTEDVDCVSTSGESVPETFFAEFHGSSDTALTATVNGKVQNIIVK